MGISHILFEMKCRKKKFSWKIRFLVSSVKLEITVDVFHLENLCHSLLDIFVNYFITWGIFCSVLQNNTTVRFSSLIYGMYALLCFSGINVNWWLGNKNFFCLRFTFAWRLVFIYTHAQLRILKFQDSVYLKSVQCLQTINCLLYTSDAADE